MREVREMGVLGGERERENLADISVTPRVDELLFSPMEGELIDLS